jgi:hypothetical protein
VQLEVIPQRFFALQVRMIVFLQLVPLLPVSVNVTGIAPSQLSVAVIVGTAGVSVRHSTFTVAFTGQPERIGLSLSFTLKVPVHVLLQRPFPRVSVTVSVSVYVESQLVPAVTFTTCRFFAPTIVPLPDIVQA